MPPDPHATLDAPDDGDGLWTPAPAVSPARYEVVGEIGRGGLGRVVAAHDRVLQRPVAIKELVSDAPGHRERFRREILLTARLQHPAIVSLYEVVAGDDGVERYAMKLVTGTTLDDAAAQADGPAGRLGLLRHVIAVTDAVAYAHAQGVIHRDIKPNNILVGAFGETVLIDWGIAKELAATAEEDVGDEVGGAAAGGLTRVGAVIGTPAYMSPEQARGEPADARSDVYALGATLWHVLTGAPPFPGDAEATISALRQGEAPGALQPSAGVPDDLAAIVRRAMAARPADRYPDALALSRDLQRFATGQLVEARVYSFADLARRFVAQHWVLVGIVSVAVVALTTLGAWSARRIVAERNAAEAALALAEERSDTMVLTHAEAVVAADPTDAAAWLTAYPADGAEPARAFLAAMDAAAGGVARVAVRTSPDGCDRLVWDAGGAVVYPVGHGVRPVDAATGAARGSDGRVDLVAPLPQGGAVVAVDAGGLSRWSVEGAVTPLAQVAAQPKVLAATAEGVVVGDAAGQLTAVDLASGEVRPLRSGDGAVVALVVAGSRWVAAWADGVWAGSLRGGSAARLAGPGVTALALAPDGAVIVGDAAGGLRELDPGGAARSLGALGGAIAHLAVSDDGRFVAAADAGTGAGVVERATGGWSTPPWTPARAEGLAWSPVDAALAVNLADGTVRLWRPASDAVATLRSGSGLINGAAFSPDGRQVAACNVDGSLRVWPTPALTARARAGHTDRVFHVAWLPDGRLVSDSEDLTVRLWSADGGTALRGHTDRVYGLDVSPDGRRVVSAGVDGVAWVWPVDGGDGVPLRGHDGRVHRAAFTDDSQTVLTAARDGTLRAWSVDGRPLRAVVAHEGSAWWLAVDGDVAWSVGADRTLRRWRWGADGPPEVVAERLGPPGGATLRPLRTGPGAVIVCDGTPRGLLVVDPGGTRRLELPVEPSCPSLVVSPDGRTVAVPSAGEVGLVDIPTGAYRTLVSVDSDVHAVAWSPDGALLATAVLDGTARLWRVADGAGAIAWRTDAPVLGVAFSPDGRRLAAGGAGGLVWTEEVDEAAWVPADADARAAWLRRLTSAAPAR
jgi:WD40 repeat protein